MRAQDGAARADRKPRLSDLRPALRALADVVLPRRAFDDHSPVQSPGLSLRAWTRIRFIDGPVCDGCGVPFEHDLGDKVRCPACLARPRAISRARAACLYDETSRDLILQLKHADAADLAGVLSAWISRSAAGLIEDADAIAPVPLHRWRLLRRRYNQAAELARPLARRWSTPFLADVLVRRRADSQAGKSALGRRRAVAGAFEVPPRRRKAIEGRRILLIDDVMTTGATLDACARALLKAGARAVDAAVIARVQETPGALI
jgi:ComF family protein